VIRTENFCIYVLFLYGGPDRIRLSTGGGRRRANGWPVGDGCGILNTGAIQLKYKKQGEENRLDVRPCLSRALDEKYPVRYHSSIG